MIRVGSFLLGFCLLTAFQPAWAKLGDTLENAKGDAKGFANSTVTTDTSSTCYTVLDINSPSGHAQEYVNNATKAVFKVSAGGRTLIDGSKLLRDADRAEIQSAPKTKSNTHSRNYKVVTAETPNLKVVHTQIHGIYRFSVTLKNAVPSCAQTE